MTPQTKQNLKRSLVALMTTSAIGVGVWKASEGDGPTEVLADGTVLHKPYVPTAGDRPTIGHGSTFYEDGTPVRLSDKPITAQRAELLADNLRTKDEKRFAATLPGVRLYQIEYDTYIDFVGQYGIGNWTNSSIRRNLLAGQYVNACKSLLLYKFQNGRDCSLSQNWGPKGCKGVWTRQQKRYADCMSVQ